MALEWVTLEGYIGCIDKGENASKLSIYAECAEDDGHNVRYKLISDTSSLPDGISFNNDGTFSGSCKVSINQNYNFSVRATAYNGDDEVEYIDGTFYLATNKISDNEAIIWTDSENLGEYRIGNDINVNFTAYCKNNETIQYKLSNNAPKGVKLTNDGNLYGIIEPQIPDTYTFEVYALSSKSSLTKKFTIIVKNGLGTNAIKCYLKLNHDNDDFYNDLKSKIGMGNIYKKYDEKYSTSTFPCIEVAQLHCFDRELLSWLSGVRSDTNELNNSFENLSSITFGKTTRLTFQKTKTLSNGDKEIVDNYDIIYKPVIENTLDWNFNNDAHWGEILDESQLTDEINWNNTMYQTPVDSDGYTPMPKEAYVFNTYNYRKRLTETKIKIHKLNQTVWYDIGSQVIVDIPTEIENVESFEYDMSRFKQIENPWIFDPIDNEEIKDILPLNDIIVLPYINDEDVFNVDENYNGYIVFLDDSENLPEWKKASPLLWSSNTSYNINDIIMYDNIYYLVIKPFVSGKIFEVNDSIQKISKTDASAYLKPKYFPTLDIMYTNANSTRLIVSEINSEEANGKYWMNDIFVNWELIFEPIYNKNIDNVGIKIYNPNNSRKPDFQLI